MARAARELIIDSFAGGGGASEGIARALGRGPDIAINHNPGAIAMHAANHPRTRHLTEDVFRVNPRQVTAGKPVGLLWASPDCRHFSRAKGGKPVEKSIRGLAWVVIKWAAEVAPRVIILENVREFQEWGPLCPRWDCAACQWRGTEGQVCLKRRGKRACPRCDAAAVRETEHKVPDPDRKGVTFRQFCGRLKGLGYKVETQVLNAADYGAPTHRRRLFLIARRDKRPIVWPEPTHGDPAKIGRDLFSSELKPWRTAAECIDWSVPCPSIFSRKKPLAEKTLKRIAMGIKRYVLDNPQPFIVRYNTEKGASDNHSRDLGQPIGAITADPRFGLVTPIVSPLTHAGERRSHPPGEPLPTVTGANRGELGLVAPVIARIGQTGGNGAYSNGTDEPVTTLTSKAEHLLVAPSLVQVGYGEREGQSPRALDLHKPLGTAVGTPKHALVSAFLARHFGGSVGAPADAPAPTVTGGGQGKSAVVAALVTKHYGGMVGVPADTPLPTTTARGAQNQLTVANLVHMNHGEKQWSGTDEPMRTVTTGGHAALVYSFLVKYFGTAIGCEVDAPAPTVTGKDRFGLVTVEIEGEPYVIVDIGMRMLRPRELARAQGFGENYVLTGTNTNQVERIGNSVCPDVAAAIVRANCADMIAKGRAAA
ncbi:C-5 cytosine-specific DNA methylase [Gemmata sp. SH-PL17]|uniref:DNA cytosine methyltransferase n=1 Tax=Gemmata sp. SH-PL17 TaxID=1630693 RepID=UPI00078E93E2|nr:DNA cytosine methyltransferase [Gemmata sp. SH-PL17]AMV24560.1 C-5 cytosine-specific DNA methylase [Gemmata sp. SH-PL17]